MLSRTESLAMGEMDTQWASLPTYWNEYWCNKHIMAFGKRFKDYTHRADFRLISYSLQTLESESKFVMDGLNEVLVVKNTHFVVIRRFHEFDCDWLIEH